MTHSTAEAVWTSDTVDVVIKALRQVGEPVTAKKLRDQLRGPHRLSAEALTELLERQVAAGRLYRFLPYVSKMPRYGTDDHQQHACRVMEMVLATGPHTLQALQQRVTKRLADCPPSRRKELLESLVSEGRVRHLPPVPGSRTLRYGIHPPDPSEYVRKFVTDFLNRVQKQANQLALAGVGKQATWEAARQLLLDGLGANGPLATVESQRSDTNVPTPMSADSNDQPPVPLALSGATERADSVESTPEAQGSENLESGGLERMPPDRQRVLIRGQLRDFRKDPRRGPLVPVKELRQSLDGRLVDKQAFDAALLQMARDGLLSLYQHDYPASLSEHERETLVRDAEGNYYNGVSLKEGK